jgi:outer membrane immunogenic protein
MKRLFSTSALVGLGLCFAQDALAANLPMPAMAPPPPPPLNWNGFYLGADASFPWTDNITFTAADPFSSVFQGFGPRSVTLHTSDIGFGLGPIVGYNLQLGPSFLIGVESDIDWGILSVTGSESSLINVRTFGSSVFSKVTADTRASVRGRAGWIWNNPKSDSTFNLAGDFLFYGTGGVAWANTSWNANVTDATAPQTIAPIHVDQTKTGSVWGGGVEWLTLASKGKMIWGIEYLHYQFKGNTATGLAVDAATGVPVNFACPNTPCVNYTLGNVDINDIRVRVTYKWD